MISLVLYGRNDNYGYNLHKRAALSLNCMAEVLSDPDDEILFVDYNTPDDFPTFPEAIQDTLTDKARQRLRILRARPHIHARYRERTHLMALEPVARNIAVRRSNPANRWILSTNTDMIFVPRNGSTLSEIVCGLPRGYYGIPRFELPESMWETLDRRDAAGVIETVSRWGWQFHLNEVIYGAQENKFDAPGDFQLVERSQLFDIHGFEEEMLLGWHVDSNLCKRLFLMYRDVGDISGEVFGYHCDHTRQITPAHRRQAKENSLKVFVADVVDPRASHQAGSWGCAGDDIEEVRLTALPGHSYVRSLAAAIGTPMERATEWVYLTRTYDRIHYDPEHVLPYLVDVLVSAPRSWSIAWFGEHPALFRLFCKVWRDLGFSGSILMTADAIGRLGPLECLEVAAADIKDICARADAFVFDFIAPEGTPLGEVSEGRDDAVIRRLLRAFYSVVESETRRMDDPDLPPRRVIAINAIHNRFETLLRGHIDFARSPASTRLRHGFVVEALSSSTAENWLPIMNVRPIATQTINGVKAHQLKRGYMLSGPGVSLTPGRYAITIDILPSLPSFPMGWLKIPLAYFFGRRMARATRPANGEPTQKPKVRGKRKFRKHAAITVEIQSRDVILQRYRASFLELLSTRHHRIETEIGVEDVIAPQPLSISVLVWTAGMADFVVRSVAIASIGDLQQVDSPRG